MSRKILVEWTEVFERQEIIEVEDLDADILEFEDDALEYVRTHSNPDSDYDELNAWSDVEVKNG